MNTIVKKLGYGASLLTAAGFCTQTALAQIVISMDMDTAAAGIQNTRSASPGDIFDAAIVVDLATQPAGLAGYSVSLRFNNTELSLNGAPAATASMPAGFGFFSFTYSPSGVGPESNNIGGGLGEVQSFEAITFGLGPTSGAYPIGTVSFKVLSPVVAAGADVTPGLFISGQDFLGDNSGSPITSYTFNSGSVVPEPSSYAVAAGGLLLAGGLIRRLRRSV